MAVGGAVVAVHTDRGDPGVPCNRGLPLGRRHRWTVPVLGTQGWQAGCQRTKRPRRRNDDAIARCVWHWRLGSGLEPAPRVRRAVMAPGTQMRGRRPRLAPPGAGGPVASGDEPTVPCLAGRVAVRAASALPRRGWQGSWWTCSLAVTAEHARCDASVNHDRDAELRSDERVHMPASASSASR